MIDSKELLRRFKTAGWPGPAQVHAMLAEVPPLGREDIERMLAVLVSKGLPGDSRDQTNRLFVFRTLAEKVVDKGLFLPYVRALRNADPQAVAVLVPLLPKVNSVEGHGELCNLLRDTDASVRRAAATVLKQVGGTTVFQTVSGFCGESSFEGRLEAMDVLTSIGRQVAIPALASVLAVGNVAEKLIALRHLGRPLPNAVMLGGFAALSGLITLDAVAHAIHAKFKGKVADANVAAATEAFARIQRGMEELTHAQAD